jgi:hypothetical protein
MSHSAPIPYLARVRDYYLALGYPEPYRFASFADVPFAPLRKPLDDCRIALVTTAAPYRPELGDQGPGALYNAAAKFYEVYAVSADPAPDLRISHIAYDRRHNPATDPACWLPLQELKRAAAVTPHIFGFPTNRSQRTTIERDCPRLLDLVHADGADAAVLAPNCPVCHQSCALAARQLEAAGIPTVIIGAAKDIIEHVGVPRLLFSDFPLGSACGRPHDRASQKETLRLALSLLVEATAPRTTVQSPLRWSDDPSWKKDYCNAALMTEREIASARAAFDREKAVAADLRKSGFP